jgi:drug/metabolite transporter (DMT)-like permease
MIGFQQVKGTITSRLYLYPQVFALILSTSGIVLFAYADGFGSHSTWGVVLSICSSASLAIFKVGQISYIKEHYVQ